MATKKKMSEKVLVDKGNLKLLLAVILLCIVGQAKAEITEILPEADLKKMKTRPKTVGDFMMGGLLYFYRKLDGGRISMNSMDMVEKYTKVFGVKVKK